MCMYLFINEAFDQARISDTGVNFKLLSWLLTEKQWYNYQNDMNNVSYITPKQ